MVPDRSRSGSSTTATGVVVQQVGCWRKIFYWWTKEREEKKRRKAVSEELGKKGGSNNGDEVRGPLNVGTMTGKGRELAKMRVKRHLDVLCPQKIKLQGIKTRLIEERTQYVFFMVWMYLFANDYKRGGKTSRNQKAKIISRISF